MTPLSEQLRDEALLRARAWIEDWDRAHPGGNRAYALFTEDIGAIARVPDPSVLPWVATTATPGPAWICGVDDRFALPGHLRSSAPSDAGFVWLRAFMLDGTELVPAPTLRDGVPHLELRRVPGVGTPDPGRWRPSQDAVPTTWEAIEARWPGAKVRDAWEALTAERGGAYLPTQRPEWPFEPVLYMDASCAYAAMPDPWDEWLCPPYWRHVPGSGCWTHPYPTSRSFAEACLRLLPGAARG